MRRDVSTYDTCFAEKAHIASRCKTMLNEIKHRSNLIENLETNSGLKHSAFLEDLSIEMS